MEYNVDNADAKITFIDVVLGFMQMKNADVYVTGSNSKMLSYDILTQFRDRGGEIRVYPLPFAEFYNEYKGDKRGRIIILMVVCRLPLMIKVLCLFNSCRWNIILGVVKK